MSNSSENIIYARELITGYVSGQEFRQIPRFPINITAREGELIALIGINGTGKTTLLKTLSGLLPVKSGEILIKNLNPFNSSRIDFSKVLSIGTTEPVKVAFTSVLDFVSLGRYPYSGFFGKLSKNDIEIVNNAINETRISHKRLSMINQLSDGEKQRAMIARTLAQDSPVILFDEPTAYLDVPNKFEILNLLKTLTVKFRKTILYSTHDIQAALQISDKIWFLTNTELINKIPEQLIFDGDLKNGFNSANVVFDEVLTNFVFYRPNFCSIGLTGAGRSYMMTKNALLRLGYQIESNKTDKLFVILNEKNDVISGQLFVETESKKFENLDELIMMIKELNLKS